MTLKEYIKAFELEPSEAERDGGLSISNNGYCYLLIENVNEGRKRYTTYSFDIRKYKKQHNVVRFKLEV